MEKAMAGFCTRVRRSRSPITSLGRPGARLATASALLALIGQQNDRGQDQRQQAALPRGGIRAHSPVATSIRVVCTPRSPASRWATERTPNTSDR